MIRHLRDIQARRRGEEVESGFTLIELLVVIVVLGILAATVVFALSGVSGQSAVAACNSDAKTIETAVQAYINSPDNANNTPPANLQALVSAPFGAPDTFLHAVPSNNAYGISLNTTGGVLVTVPKGSTAAGDTALYDDPNGGTNRCSAA